MDRQLPGARFSPCATYVSKCKPYIFVQLTVAACYTKKGLADNAGQVFFICLLIYGRNGHEGQYKPHKRGGVGC